jgi:MYXO-CTERM domain-containing protein
MRTLLALLLLSGTASAHITMTSPKPRTLANKAPPCGAANSTRGSDVATFGPGEVITVEWDETVDHPGHYRIAFDDDGNDVFQNPNNPNDNFPFTLMEPIADRVGGGHYTQQITLPTTLCDNCTLQLMQIMTVTVPYNSFYYQCADITIADGGGSGSGSGSGSGDGGASSGGCSTGSGSGAGAIVLLAGLVARRKRR